MPPALRLDSRCFRLVSEGRYASMAGGRDYDRASARVEAVVVFSDDGEYDVVYWNTQRKS